MDLVRESIGTSVGLFGAAQLQTECSGLWNGVVADFAFQEANVHSLSALILYKILKISFTPVFVFW